MHKNTAFFLAIGLLQTSVFQAVAWSGAGHMVIAAEAYRQLIPALKAKVVDLLKAHPDYAK